MQHEQARILRAPQVREFLDRQCSAARRRISSRLRSRHLHTAGGHHGLGCAPTGRRRRISSIEVGKIEFGMTVHALLDFPELLETEVVIAESLPLAESRDAEDYAGALATSELHSVLLCSSRRLHRCHEHSLL